MPKRSTQRRRVVILGGGFAGLAAALELRADRTDVTLVDQRSSFEFLPNIHELVSGVKTPELLRIPLDRALRQASHRFVHDTVTGVDPVARTVSTESGPALPYDALIVALGGVDATRGVPGVEEHAYPFKSVDACARIGRRLRTLARGSGARVVVVGGGLEGVEALGEILRRYREDGRLDVSLVEAQERLLPEAPASLDRELRRLGAAHDVSFLTGAPVARIEADEVVLADGRSLDSDLTIWTGGPSPPALLAEWGLAPAGAWAPVDEALQSKEHTGIFVVGDAAELPTPLPKQAYHALDMGVRAGRNAFRLLAERELRAFRPSGKPTLISFGDLSCFLVSDRLVLAGPALGAAKEAVFSLVMTQLDRRPVSQRLPRIANRADRALRELLWPTLSSFDAICRQANVAVLSAD